MGKTYKKNDIYKEKNSYRKSKSEKHNKHCDIERWDSTRATNRLFKESMHELHSASIDSDILINHLENAKTFKGKRMCQMFKEKYALANDSHQNLFADIVHYIEKGYTEFKELQAILIDRRKAKIKYEQSKVLLKGKYMNKFKFDNGKMEFGYKFKTIEMIKLTGMEALPSVKVERVI